MKKRIYKFRVLVGIIIALLFVFGLNLFITSNYLAPQFDSGLSKLLYVLDKESEPRYLVKDEGIISSVDYDTDGDRTYIKISKDLYNACLWLKQISNSNTKIGTTAIWSASRRYSVAVLSNCWFWDDPEMIIFDVLSGDEEAFNKMMEAEVDYLIVNKGTADEMLNKWYNTEVILENEEVQIIKIF